MRTTIRLPDEFYNAVRARAADEGRTFTSFLEEALREHLARSAAQVPPAPYKVVPFEGTGVRPGVDLADSAHLLEVMES